MTALSEIPNVQFVPVSALEQDLGIQPVLHHIRCAPFAGDHGVEAQMPPEVIGQILRPSIQFPFAEDIEAVVIDYENSTRTVAAGGSEGARIDSLRAAVQRVRRNVAGSSCERFRLDHFDDLRLSRIGLGVDDVYA